MRVITLGSGLGGSGKTFLAANLGLALARSGVKTCLVDLDLRSADLHLMLGILRPAQNLLHLLRGAAAALEDVMMPVDETGMLQLIPGAGETVRGLAQEEVNGLIEDIARLPAEVAIVDLAAGFGHQQLDIFLSGDVQWVVTRAERPAVEAAARFVRLARLRRGARGTAASQPRRPKVYSDLDALVRDMTVFRQQDVALDRGRGVRPEIVLNCCRPDASASTADLKEALEESGPAPAIIVELPQDDQVERSISDLTPVIDLSPHSGISKAIQDLAAGMERTPAADELAAPVAPEPVPV